MGVIGKTVDEYVMKPFPNNAHEFAYIGVMVANSSCVIMLLATELFGIFLSSSRISVVGCETFRSGIEKDLVNVTFHGNTRHNLVNFWLKSNLLIR